MRLYSYVVRWDYGFAPNPFFGTCTLATCKAKIRKYACKGDWIVGTGSKRHEKQGHLVYVMQVADKMTFNEYWNDNRFQLKRSNRHGSLKQAFGDNIYFLGRDGQWCQIDSRHSLADGSPNQGHLQADTAVDNVLIGGTYAYWGGSGPKIPPCFRNWQEWDICSGRHHKCRFPDAMVAAFVGWFMALNKRGFLGEPSDWK